MKKFFTTTPGQKDLNEFVYKPTNNSELEYNEKTSLPILNAVNAFAEEGEEIAVYFITLDNEWSNKNLITVKEQLEVVVKAKNLKCRVENILISDDEEVSTFLQLYGKLLKCIDDNDEIHTCVTFGTKLVPLVQLMALRYAYHARTNVYIGSIIYGKAYGKLKSEGVLDLYDVTSLFYMEELSENFCRAGIENPDEKIASVLLSIEGGE